MDKWGKLAEIIQQAFDGKDEEEGAKLAGSAALAFACEIGRALEDIGASFDRIATALEK